MYFISKKVISTSDKLFPIVLYLKYDSNLYLNTLCKNLQGTFVIFIAISRTVKPSLKNIEASMPI